MKRIFLLTGMIVLAVLIFSFSDQVSPKKATPKKTVTAASTGKPKTGVTPKAIEEGKELLAKSDCLACHRVDIKIVGPAYIDVAKKYPATDANYTLLANKIIKGGSGVWGQIPMAPHAGLSLADAKKMTMYILSVK